MDAQAEAETNTYNLPTMPDSDDSEEENSQEEQPATSWNELSIIDRVGLNSVEMSEKDLETAFSQIALAFRCDQYTLKQRLQAEEHARNLAEENIQLELTRGRETLEALKDLCLDITRSKILQRLELSLDILGGTVERISNTAEVLGAVHQEARVSRAVELMVAHVENLRRRQDRNVAEMEDSKNHRASPEPEDGDSKMKSHQHPCCRRRVSVSLIQIPEKTKRELTKLAGGSSKKPSLTCPSPTLSSESSCVAVTKDNSCTAEDRPLVPDEEASAAQLPAEPTPTPTPAPTPAPDPECPPSKQVATRKIQNKNSPLDTLRQRHKSKAALSKKKAAKDKKTINIHRQLSVGSCGATWRHRPLTRWLYRCRWALLCMYIFVLLSVLTLTYLLWNVHEGTFEP